MIYDQTEKMLEQRTDRDSCSFLLSWTLTQDNTQATTCALGTADSILDLAQKANNTLGHLTTYCTTKSYPNIISIDNVGNVDNVIIFVMQINKFFATGKGI